MGRQRRLSGRDISIAVVGGFAVSLVAGLLGVGGGVLLVPLLVLLLKRPQHVAHATSLVAILFASMSGGVRFAVGSSVSLEAAVVLAVAAVMGAQVGGRFLPKMSDPALRRLFAVVLMAVAIRFLIGGSGAAEGGLTVPDLGLAMLAAHFAVGVGIGISSAVLGVGGGVLLVPILVLGFGYGQHIAEGTSLAVIVPTALSGAIAHQRNGYTDWRLGFLLGFTGVVGGALGAHFALASAPDTLGRLLGLLLATVALIMMIPPRRDPPPGTERGG
jgi:uncharacterized protein